MEGEWLNEKLEDNFRIQPLSDAQGIRSKSSGWMKLVYEDALSAVLCQEEPFVYIGITLAHKQFPNSIFGLDFLWHWPLSSMLQLVLCRAKTLESTEPDTFLRANDILGHNISVTDCLKTKTYSKSITQTCGSFFLTIGRKLSRQNSTLCSVSSFSSSFSSSSFSSAPGSEVAQKME